MGCTERRHFMRADDDLRHALSIGAQGSEGLNESGVIAAQVGEHILNTKLDRVL